MPKKTYLCKTMTDRILSVRDLSISFRQHDGTMRRAVEGVTFDVMRGRTLGIVGESGSGKSVSCMALLHLLATPPAHIDSGTALFYDSATTDGDATPHGTDLLTLDEQGIRHYRGNRISMIFQEPMTSLNPVQRCGAQVVEMLRLHEKVSKSEARQRVLELFDEVQLPHPDKIFNSYPHEISGGQKQRVMIAMALVCHPDIVIADEPTTALDVIVQKTILDLLRSMQQRHNIGIIFISHDLGVIGQVADDVAVMYKGTIVEQGAAAQVLANPQHPYTRGLLACRPPLDCRPLRLPTVADFMQEGSDSQNSLPATPSAAATQQPSDERQPLVSVRDLHVDFATKRTLFGRPKQMLHAVDGVSFDILEGETLGLVGGSGCGKTTLGRTLLRLINKQSGTITYRGTSLDTMSRHDLHQLRTRIQIIFQDPYSSLNPHQTIGDAISEPLKVHHIEENALSRHDRVVHLLEQVGLSPDHYNRYPHEFSGGQRQRIVIARALIMQPELIVCDESVSALDVSVQAQVLNLLGDLKRNYNYTYLFITHDLSVIHFVADRIMVMQSGKIVERGNTDTIFNNPQHAYTRQLLDAIPRI